MPDVRIEPARVEDVPVILSLIQGLADYEKLAHECVATEEALRRWLFGDVPAAEVVLAWANPEPANAEPGTWNAEPIPVGFALFMRNFSTFLARPGLYLEDLFVVPEWRGRGVGRRLLTHLARIAVTRGYGRFEWAVLDWNAPAVAFYRRMGATIMDDWRICRVTGDALAALARD